MCHEPPGVRDTSASEGLCGIMDGMGLTDAQRAAQEANRTSSGRFGQGGQSPAADPQRAAEYNDPWMAAGITPDEARRWYSAGVGLAEASGWADEAFGPEEGLRWRAVGFTPAQATAWAEELDGRPSPEVEAQAWWSDPRRAYAAHAAQTGAPGMTDSEIEGVWANETLWDGTPESKRIRVRRDCIVAGEYLAASTPTAFGQTTNREAYRDMGFSEKEMGYWSRMKVSPRNATIAACLGITPGVAADAISVDPSLSPATASRIQVRTAIADANCDRALAAAKGLEVKDGLPINQPAIEHARATVVQLRKDYSTALRSAPNPYDEAHRLFTDAVDENDYRRAGAALRAAAEEIEADAAYPSRWLLREMRGQDRMVS